MLWNNELKMKIYLIIKSDDEFISISIAQIDMVCWYVELNM